MTQKERAKRRRQRRNRRIALTVATVVLTAVFAIGGTIAWLTDSTGDIENTFTAGDINITLTEGFNTDSNGDGTDDCWTAKLIPGTSYDKDPVVTVKKGSEDCYLFVKFEEIGNPVTYLDYASSLTTEVGWTKLNVTGVTNVWYREVTASDVDQEWHLLSDDTITVRDSVTKDNMNSAVGASLKYTAYACQKDNIPTVAEAWEKVQPSGT